MTVVFDTLKLEADNETLHQDVAALKSEMERLRFDTKRWITNALVGVALGTYALVAFCCVIVV
jgi:hypothetical protein